MDIGDKQLPHVVQRPHKGWLLAVTGIDGDPFKLHPPSPRLTHDIRRMVAFSGSVCAHPPGYRPGRIAPRCRSSPSGKRLAMTATPDNAALQRIPVGRILSWRHPGRIKSPQHWFSPSRRKIGPRGLD
jgi:hypothetical protein